MASHLRCVSNVLLQEGRVLLLKRSTKKQILPGKWSVCVGTIEVNVLTMYFEYSASDQVNESPLESAKREIREELGSLGEEDGLHLVSIGRRTVAVSLASLFDVFLWFDSVGLLIRKQKDSDDRVWESQPLLWMKTGKVTVDPSLNHEHSRFEWSIPQDVCRYDTVEGLPEIISSLVPHPVGAVDSFSSRSEVRPFVQLYGHLADTIKALNFPANRWNNESLPDMARAAR